MHYELQARYIKELDLPAGVVTPERLSYAAKHPRSPRCRPGKNFLPPGRKYGDRGCSESVTTDGAVDDCRVSPSVAEGTNMAVILREENQI